jgi:hypothetical protein
MADDYTDDNDCMSCEAFKKPIVQNAIEKTVDAFFEVMEGTDLEAGDGMVAAAAAVASIADAIYIGIQESAAKENIEGVEPDDFREKFLSMVEDYLATLMDVDVEEDDDEEDMIPVSVTTH